MAQLSDAELNKLKQLLNEPKSKPKDPIQQMIEDGFGVLTPAGQRALIVIRERYSGDFKDFFTALSKRYDENKRATAETKRLSGVLSKINSVSSLIDKILTTSDPFVARDSGLELREMLADIDNELVFFSDVDNITKTLSRGFEDTAAQFKDRVNIQKLKEDQAKLVRKTKEITGRPSIGKTIGGWGKSLGKTALTVATLDMMGTGTWIRGSLAKRAERKQRLENMEFESSGTNVGPAPSGLSAVGEAADEDRLGRSRRGRYDTSSSISNGLFSFFNRGAHDASWTKQLLAAARGDISVDGGVGKRGGGFMAFLPAGIAAIMGTIAAGIVGATIGWLAGRAIGRIEIYGQTVDVHTENAFRQLMGKTDKQIANKRLADAYATGRPEVYEATRLELENPTWSAEKIQNKVKQNLDYISRRAGGQEVNENYNFEGDRDHAPMSIEEQAYQGFQVMGGRTGIASEIYPSGNGYETSVDGKGIWGKTPAKVREKVEKYNESRGIDTDWDWRDKIDSKGESVPIDMGDNNQKEQTQVLNEILKETVENNEAQKTKTPISVPAGKDMNTTRSPVSLINTGSLTN